MTTTATWPSSSSDYVKQEGFTHVEFMPLAEHPVLRLLGLSGHRLLCDRLPSRYAPTTSRYLVDKLHQAGIGVIMDWVPAHFPKDALRARPLRRHPAVRGSGPAARRAPGMGHLCVQLRTPRSTQLPGGQRPVLAGGRCHVDALRVDAVSLHALPRLQPRSPASWRPNIYGGRENLEAIDFLKEATATAYKNNPGVMMIAEESTAWPGITAPTSAGGLGFGIKWNMGWMHDTLRVSARGAHQPQVAPQRDHLLHGVRLLRTLRIAHQPRRSRVRQGFPVRQDAGR